MENLDQKHNSVTGRQSSRRGALGLHDATSSLNKSGHRGKLGYRGISSGTERLVVFNVGNLTIRQAWGELGAMLQPEALTNVVKITRVTTMNRPIRFDMWVKGVLADNLKRTIRNKTVLRTPYFCRVMRDHMLKPVKALGKWRVDLYKAWRDRKGTRRPNIAEKPDVWHDGIATFNLNGFPSKKEDLCRFLEKGQVSVCAIQETLVSERNYPIRCEGYTVYTQHWAEGFRGQAVLVKNHLTSYEVGRVEGVYIHVKINGIHQMANPLHVIAVYLPSGGAERGRKTTIILDLLVLHRKITLADPEASVVILGDWNYEGHLLDVKLRTMETGLSRLPVRGSPLTRFPKMGRPTSIDHIVCNINGMLLLRHARVHRECGISDHRPLVAQFRVKPGKPGVPIERWTYDTQMMKRYAREVVNSNRWNVLPVEECEPQDESLEGLTTHFTSTMTDVTKEHGALRMTVNGKLRFPKKLKSLWRKRDMVAKKIAKMASKDGQPSQKLLKQWKGIQDTYKKAHNQWKMHQQYKVVGRTCQDIRGCDYKALWNRITRKIAHGGQISGVQPVRNKQGKLCVTNEDIMDAIAEHYDDLANADPGNSQDSEYW
ncbi:DNase I-like protein, partial [Coprinopsis marcescibilis]